MTDAEKQAILDEIIALSSPPKRKATDITAAEFASRAGCSVATAQTRLRRLVTDGLLETEILWDPEIQHNVRVWRKVGNGESGSAVDDGQDPGGAEGDQGAARG